MPICGNRRNIIVVLQSFTIQIVIGLLLLKYAWERRARESAQHSFRKRRFYSLISRVPYQVAHLREIISANDTDCINNLRLSKNAFARSCVLVAEIGGLTATQSDSVGEQVAMFLSILAHHKKNRIIKHDFKRSNRTESKCFNDVLLSILRLYPLLVANPDPMPNDSADERWKWFKGCLGALDGTYINVRLPKQHKARYRSQKGQICVNVLGVVDIKMNFVFVLTGWEGSTADG